MTKQKGPSNQFKIIAAAAVVIVGAIGLTAILLNSGSDSSSTSGDAVEFGEVTIIGAELSRYDAEAEDDAVGQTAPEIEGFSIDGRPIEIIPNGRPKMIVLLAHWCEFCQAEVPTVQAWLDEGNLPDEIEMWSVATNTNPGAPNYPPSAWFAREGWTPEVLVDDQEFAVADAFGLSGFPFWIIVDGDGTIVARNAGQTDIEQIETWVDDLLETS
jgi:thiol-disulfide isomerase/thioredoxin